jgi:hypothetical protein
LAFFHLNSQNTGKFSAEPAHAAFEPIAAIVSDNARDRFNQTRPIPSDQGHHEWNLHCAVLIRLAGASKADRCQGRVVGARLCAQLQPQSLDIRKPSMQQKVCGWSKPTQR